MLVWSAGSPCAMKSPTSATSCQKATRKKQWHPKKGEGRGSSWHNDVLPRCALTWFASPPPPPGSAPVLICRKQTCLVGQLLATDTSPLFQLHAILRYYQLWSKYRKVDWKEQRKSPLLTALDKGELPLGGRLLSIRAHC
jgi:hypothetical protein